MYVETELVQSNNIAKISSIYGDREEGRERRLPGLLYADDLVLCVESHEDLRTMVGCFVEMCRRGPKVNACKSKVMMLNEEEGLKYEVHVDGK